jgi:hypothetical protein
MGRKLGKRQICFLVLLVALVQSVCVGSGNPEKQLRVKLSVISQDNCQGNSSSVPVIGLRLRLEITNSSDRKLIVARKIGAAWYTYTLAKNEQALAAGIYEENPNIDWVVTESDRQSPPAEAPSSEFAILDPGKSFDVETTVSIPTYPQDALLGDHVIQLNLGTWPHVSPPEQFRESWKKYGDLVYKPVKSESVFFRVPPEKDFTKCRASANESTPD